MQRLLRHLDQVVVPRLARGFARAAGGGLRLRLLTGIAVVGVIGALLGAVWATRRPVAPSADSAAMETVRVGVVQGQSVPLYARQARSELTGLLKRPTASPVETYALVSLRAYLAPERLTPVLGGVSVVEVYARVPLSGAVTQSVRIPAFTIPADVVAGMAQVARKRAGDADDLRRVAAKLQTTDATEVDLRQGYLGDSTVAAAEAEAYRAGCACVYAAVVRATPAALDQIAARPEVRAVDPAPEVRRLDRAVFLPPLPEQLGQAPAGATATATATPPASPSAEPTGSAGPPPSPEPTTTPSDGPETPAESPSAISASQAP
ncbi:hypothetical protein Cs7R123_22800 [Catellatospora sp. TT07R-123]|uniref:hypothetical protein n=1 Tax=Catellatospora sp. TT07R-123 TaxID=2733863 RepID=UPI001B08D879|nr:hypothetical protein [Catellatospora sp. TT07R-123]GHJ44938.1 hypothetical protein Cs7R123_22800 [Catellatospora sp. TT07R-123]